MIGIQISGPTVVFQVLCYILLLPGPKAAFCELACMITFIFFYFIFGLCKYFWVVLSATSADSFIYNYK